MTANHEPVGVSPEASAMRTWAQITARPITSGVRDWLDDLVERWGEGRVVDAMREEAGTGHFSRLIERARDRLARSDLSPRQRPAPLEIGRDQLLRIVRGEEPVPTEPFIYRSDDLTGDEYFELVHCNRFGVKVNLP